MKKIFSLLVSLSIIFTLSGCMDNMGNEPAIDDKDPVVDEKDNPKEDKVNELEAKALSDIKKEEYQTKDKIKEATEYINNNVNMSIKTDAIHEKLIYYSSYLKHIGNDEAKDHDITKLGDKTYTYVTNIYTEKEDEDSSTSKDLKDDLTVHIDNIKEDIDTNVDEFHNLIKG